VENRDVAWRVAEDEKRGQFLAVDPNPKAEEHSILESVRQAVAIQTTCNRYALLLDLVIIIFQLLYRLLLLDTFLIASETQNLFRCEFKLLFLMGEQQ